MRDMSLGSGLFTFVSFLQISVVWGLGFFLVTTPYLKLLRFSEHFPLFFSFYRPPYSLFFVLFLAVGLWVEGWAGGMVACSHARKRLLSMYLGAKI